MFALHGSHSIPWATMYRWLARMTGAFLIVGWLALFIDESMHWGLAATKPAVPQGVAIALIFAGYLIGWRWELLGGALAVAGTLVFFAVNVATIGNLPDLEAAWFAAPGLFYLLAWRSSKHLGLPATS